MERFLLSSFGYVGILAIVALLFPLGAIGTALLANRVVRVHRPNRRKLLTYECGMDPIGDAWIQFNTRYYLFALLFVVFDVEAIFLYPWAVAYRRLGVYAMVEIVIFIGILLVAYAYAWKKKAMEWK
ncbi:MAG: NADH-quinone oxidoreductase subunit A [Dehalococcoidia bacterium]|nr:NADH-quinone oxidoreductase subunit A [Dehalococcoidia bacterium]